jgi:3-deoxy-D-manno-octulosonate 8-phosphate phosphatase (KDO 8-P phosphatase)
MSHVSRDEFKDRLGRIKLLALDVDGVLTDDSIWFGSDDTELKRFNISDGFFMVLAMRAGLELAIVSGRYSAATDSRMKDLGVKHIFQGKKSKVEMITPLLKKLKLEFKQVAFVGNEILDIELAREAGLSIAVADASPRLKERVDYVTKASGGKGAVREILENYFEAIGLDPVEYIK